MTLLVACDFDEATSVGELGNLSYSVSTDFDIEENVVDVTFTTRHAHDVGIRALDQDGPYDEPEAWRHFSDDAVIDEEGSYPAVRKATPGDAEVETWLDGTLVDRITLAFDDPTSLELRSFARRPWEDVWGVLRTGEPVTVGSQLAFLAIPLDAEGQRLFTEEPAIVDAEPRSHVVPDRPVDDVWEDGPRNFLGYESVAFYVIDSGTVTFELSLPEHDLTVEQTLEVRE